MSWRIIDLFQDPSPNGIINQRYVQTMMKLAEMTDLKPNEKEDFINIVLLIGKKMVATWKHYNNYCTTGETQMRVSKFKMRARK